MKCFVNIYIYAHIVVLLLILASRVKILKNQLVLNNLVNPLFLLLHVIINEQKTNQVCQ